MKKALIPALLVACAVFAPFLSNAVEFPDRVSKAACAAARPLFWHLWYELLNREIATGSQRARDIGAASDWQAELRSELAVCIVFHGFLKQHRGRLAVRCGKTRNACCVDSTRLHSSHNREAIFHALRNSRQFNADTKPTRRPS